MVALLLALLLPLLVPWHAMLPQLEPEDGRVILPRMPTNFNIDIVHAKRDGTLPLAKIAERYTRRNLPVLLRPHTRPAVRRHVVASPGEPDAAVAAALGRRIQTRVQPSRAVAAGTQLTARIFGGAPAQSKPDGDFYPTRLMSWGEFLRSSQRHENVSIADLDAGGCCYAARLPVPADLPELLELLRLPLASEHPLASTVGEPYPHGPVLYASHGQAESTPIHFDEEENCAQSITGANV